MDGNKLIKIGRYTADISHWQKVLFSKLDLRKSDIINYYARVADRLLPFLKNRIVTLHRFPAGIEGENFYQKKYQDYYPAFIKSYEVPLIEGGSQKQILCDKKIDLLYLAGQGTIAFHVWLSKISSLQKPSRIVFDLDPFDLNQKTAMEALTQAAHAIKAIFDAMHIPSYLMTTGSKGLHVVIPIKPMHPFETVRQFAKNIADYLCEKNPTVLTTSIAKSARHGKIFIDYIRNSYGQTSIVPYSLRAMENAPIATPITWNELKTLKSSQDFTITNIFNRLKKLQDDPWLGFHELPPVLKPDEFNALIMRKYKKHPSTSGIHRGAHF